MRATIATVAELGEAGASFAAIAARGGLSSTRLISYHFDDRAELMREVATTVVGDLAAAVGSAMHQARSPRDAVHAYLRANVAFVDTHRPEMTALAALLFAGALPADTGAGDAAEQALAGLIAAGVEAGQFGPVDPIVAAGVLQRAVEGVSLHLHRDPAVDLTTLGDDLVTFFDSGLGTRRPRARRPRA